MHFHSDDASFRSVEEESPTNPNSTTQTMEVASYAEGEKKVQWLITEKDHYWYWLADHWFYYEES